MSAPEPTPAPESPPPVAAALPGKASAPVVERSGQSFGGTAYRSFNTPYSRVKAAAVSALNARGFRIVAFGMLDKGESIDAASRQQRVSIELERLQAGAAELRVAASGVGFFEDRKAAAAIVDEVARILQATRTPAKR